MTEDSPDWINYDGHEGYEVFYRTSTPPFSRKLISTVSRNFLLGPRCSRYYIHGLHTFVDRSDSSSSHRCRQMSSVDVTVCEYARKKRHLIYGNRSSCKHAVRSLTLRWWKKEFNLVVDDTAPASTSRVGWGRGDNVAVVWHAHSGKLVRTTYALHNPIKSGASRNCARSTCANSSYHLSVTLATTRPVFAELNGLLCWHILLFESVCASIERLACTTMAPWGAIRRHRRLCLNVDRRGFLFGTILVGFAVFFSKFLRSFCFFF